MRIPVGNVGNMEKTFDFERFKSQAEEGVLFCQSFLGMSNLSILNFQFSIFKGVSPHGKMSEPMDHFLRI